MNFFLKIFLFLSLLACSSTKRAPSSITKDLKIAIVGAGAAGISAAVYLKKKGYHNIALFEKEKRVGGKSNTFIYQGRTYDMGTLWAGRSYEEMKKLAKEAGEQFVKDKIPLYVYEKEKKEFISFEGYRDQSFKWTQYHGAIINLEKKLRTKTKFYQAGGQNIDKELYIPTLKYADKYNFKAVLEPFRLFLTFCGYEFFDDVPLFYNIKLMKLLFPQGVKQRVNHVITHNKILNNNWNMFHHGLLRPENGYQQVWESIVHHHQLDIKLKNLVREVIPTPNGVLIVNGKGQQQLFDKVIMATPPNIISKIVQLPNEKKKLFSKFQYTNYLTTLFTADGLPTKMALAFKDNIKKRKYNSILGLYNQYQNSRQYIAYQILENKDDLEPAWRQLKKDIQEMGGEVIKKHHTSDWNYFPRLSQQDLEDETLQKLEKLQGYQGFYFTGSYMNFETVEHSVRYSKYLIDKFF